MHINTSDNMRDKETEKYLVIKVLNKQNGEKYEFTFFVWSKVYVYFLILGSKVENLRIIKSFNFKLGFISFLI